MKYALPLFSSEIIKLKRSAVWYILLLGVALTATGVFIGHLLDAHNMVKINIDPWDRYFRAALAIFNLFIVVPYTVLLVSAVIFVEQRANAWKYLYTLPFSRGRFFLTKWVLVALLYLVSILFLLTGVVLSGYLLDILRPEYEFIYYRPQFAYLLQEMGHFFLASLGLIGFQYWLSLRFRNILIPLGIGVFGFVFGIIMSVTSQKLALYLPYSLPMIVRDFDMFRNEHIQDSFISGLNNVEVHSILIGLAFLLLGYWQERNRKVE
ncbi:MAG: ABC transporter permease [Bacteroidota bacterium]